MVAVLHFLNLYLSRGACAGTRPRAGAPHQGQAIDYDESVVA